MYKQAISQTAGMSSQIEELKALVQQLAQSSNQTAAAAGEQLQQAGTQRAQAGMQQIQNNLQSIQQKYQFSDDAEQAFMTFVNERGYMLEDLMDKTLADKLGSDFKAVQQSPEIDRLRAIAERRQAFTGTSTPSPTGGAATPNPAPSADQEFMDAATQTAMRNRNMIE